ncbi:hypothetical protein Peur_065724 [Populus x canadensis]
MRNNTDVLRERERERERDLSMCSTAETHGGGGCESVFPPPVTGSALHSKKHNMLVPAKSSFPANFCVQYTSPKFMQLIKDNEWYLAGIKSMF